MISSISPSDESRWESNILEYTPSITVPREGWNVFMYIQNNNKSKCVRHTVVKSDRIDSFRYFNVYNPEQNFHRETDLYSSRQKTSATAPSILFTYYDNNKLDYLLSSEIEPMVQELINNGLHEVFEEGVRSKYSCELTKVVERYQNTAVEVIKDYLKLIGSNTTFFVETLTTLGQINDPVTHEKRLDLACDYLSSQFPRIRYGAIIALSSMRDKHAIPFLERARSTEQIRTLRSVLDQVIQYLNRL